MEKFKLILLEGIPGSGKTTTTSNLEKQINDIGSKVKAYDEFNLDNPIRSKMVDSLRLNDPTLRSNDPETSGQGADGIAIDQSVYSLDQWSNLSERCNASDEVVILESRYWQNSLAPILLSGASDEKIFDEFKKIHARLKECSALLIFLQPLDVRSHLLHLLSSRKVEWGEFIAKTISDSAWAKKRNLTGQDAFFGFVEAWAELCNELFSMHEGQKIKLSEPHLDWDKSLSEIYKKAGLNV